MAPEEQQAGLSTEVAPSGIEEDRSADDDTEEGSGRPAAARWPRPAPRPTMTSSNSFESSHDGVSPLEYAQTREVCSRLTRREVPVQVRVNVRNANLPGVIQTMPARVRPSIRVGGDTFTSSGTPRPVSRKGPAERQRSSPNVARKTAAPTTPGRALREKSSLGKPQWGRSLSEHVGAPGRESHPHGRRKHPAQRREFSSHPVDSRACERNKRHEASS